MKHWSLKAAFIMAALQLFTAVSAFGFVQEPSLDPQPPFVICKDQQYALCAEADCFVYNGVAYCQCDILTGDSISLQLSYSTPAGERNVCDVNQQGATNGYMVSTFSFPENVEKGGSAAVYTCPGSANKGKRGGSAGSLWPMRWRYLLQQHQRPKFPGLHRPARG